MKQPINALARYLSKRVSLVYFIVLFLAIADRINCYLRFAIVYTDGDQTVQWLISRDLMNGEFYGPCFYGQSYNPIIESILAIPFIWSGLEFSSALPLVTTLLSFSPFLLLSIYFFKKVNKVLGILPLCISLLMSVEYQMLTSISRGFVTGIPFAIIGLLIIYFHSSRHFKFLGGLLIGFGIYVNPNSALLLPILLMILLEPMKPTNRRLVLLGFLLGLSSIFFNLLFYNLNPGLTIHPSPPIGFSLSTFLKVLQSLDNYFDFISPVFWRAGWITLILFLVATYLLWKNSLKREAFTAFTLLLAIIISFSYLKVADGTNSVFFSGARMYLAYPFLILFLLFILARTRLKRLQGPFLIFLLLLSTVSVTIKFVAFDQLMSHALRGSAYSVVEVSRVDNLKSTCQDMINFSELNLDLVLLTDQGINSKLISYGCPCLLDSFPTTLLTWYDRRPWTRTQVMNSIFEKVLIHGFEKTSYANLKSPEIRIVKEDFEKGWLLIEHNQETQKLVRQVDNKQ